MVSYDFLLFMLKTETTTRGTNSMPFLVFRRGHLRSTSGIICGPGSFCGPVRGSFPVWESFPVGDHLRRCTVTRSRNLAVSKGLTFYACRVNLSTEEIKFDVTWSYVKRQKAKMTSEFVFFFF